MPEPLEDIKVLVTNRDEAPAPDTVLSTPGAHKPNVQTVTVDAWKLIAIRAVRTYLQSLLGILTAVPAANAVGIPLGDFTVSFVAAASVAFGPMVFSIIQNTIEILARMDVNAPTLRA